MKNYLRFFLFFVAGLSPSFALDMSGHDLFSQLKDYYIEKGMTDQQLLNAGRAYGYVCAIYDSNREELTIPEGTKPTHLIAAVYKFLIDNPNLRYKKANILVFEAITEAYPSQKQSDL
jgi:hypothetical protein